MLHAALFALAVNGSLVADARCNDYAVTRMQSTLRSYESATPPPDQRDARFSSLAQIRRDATDESVILQSVCPERDLLPLASSLFAIEAWALVLQSDLANAEYAESCPAAQVPVVRGFLAEAWLNLTRAQRDETPMPALVTEVVGKVQARAKSTGLTLPKASETSNYWMTELQKKGRDAAQACKQ